MPEKKTKIGKIIQAFAVGTRLVVLTEEGKLYGRSQEMFTGKNGLKMKKLFREEITDEQTTFAE